MATIGAACAALGERHPEKQEFTLFTRSARIEYHTTARSYIAAA